MAVGYSGQGHELNLIAVWQSVTLHWSTATNRVRASSAPIFTNATKTEYTHFVNCT